MPDAALIEALDQLRERYVQRQKLATNLQAALKGSNSTLNKTSRVLREYNERRSDGAEVAARSLEVFAGLRLREEAIDPLMPDLRREEKQLTTLTGALKDALAALRGEAVDVVRLGKAVGALQNSKIQDAALTALLPELERELEEGQRTLGDTFGLALRHALATQGIELGGRPPRFEIGPFELAANFVSRNATLSYGKELVNRRVALSVDTVVKTYQRATKTIMGRSEDGAKWVEQLYNAWEAVRRRRGISEPRANIVECFAEFVLLRQSRAFRTTMSKHDFAEYSRAQFAYDFYQFTNSKSAVEYKGLRAFGIGATKSHTDSPERSIWIVEGDNPHMGRYIADVKFDRDE